MKITFDLDLDKFEDRLFAESMISKYNHLGKPTPQPPASLQIHTPTTDKAQGSDAVTVWTSSDENVEEALKSLGPDVDVKGVMVDYKEPSDVEKTVEKKASDDGTDFVIKVPDEVPICDPAILGQAIKEKLQEQKEEIAKPKKEKPEPSEEQARAIAVDAKKNNKEKPAAKKPEKSESGKKIRLLMLEACKLPDVDIAAVNEAIYSACDVVASKDVKPDQADTAVAAIQALIDGAKGGKA
jgi:hypothetical protein